MTSKKWLLSIVISLIFVMSLVVLNIVYASDSTPPLGDISYTVEKRPSGTVRVHVTGIDFTTRAARDHYAKQQYSAALELVRLGQGEDIPLQLTFAYPLPIEELHLLAKDTSLKTELLVFEARDSDQELHTVAVRSVGAGEIADLASLQLGLEMRNLQLVGVIAVHGTTVASEAGLGKLVRDERAYIVDITPYVLAKQVAVQQNVAVEQVQVVIPAPFWRISKERVINEP